MKKIIMCLFIAMPLMLLTGCGQKESSDVELAYVMEEITKEIDSRGYTLVNLSSQANAALFGLSSDKLSEGVAVYSKDSSEPDRIIIVRAKSKEEVQDVEFALQTHRTQLINAWTDDETQSEKLDDSLIKTRNDCIILAVASNTDKIEKIFDRYI
jgi:outer membrane lipoprotein-sorting protein